MVSRIPLAEDVDASVKQRQHIWYSMRCLYIYRGGRNFIQHNLRLPSQIHQSVEYYQLSHEERTEPASQSPLRGTLHGRVAAGNVDNPQIWFRAMMTKA